ncbi:P-loop containing nucleoside triphosphate hydrolase protein [Mycena olivaceomarginata]|nr:P-loop containing nucleoside triphosphate hydrolase protein [Mycena olivaceomarginata]
MDSWRVALLGDGGVGKTALATQFTLNQTYNPTIEDAFRKHFLVDNKLCFLEVLDTAGQGLDYAALRDQWVRCVAQSPRDDITTLLSFKRLEVFLQAVRRIKRGEAIMVLVGNKSDKESEREVTKQQAFELANCLGCEIIETSARTAVNINAAFAHVVLVQQKNQNRCVIF